MTEQEKRAKVIAELERVADEANPWKESPPLRCDISYPLLIDAITLLKAQEPRVLTLEELQSIGETWNKNTPPYLWVEILDAPEWYIDDRMWVPYSFVRDTINVGSEKYNKDNYLKCWRCWNKKPTDDQRKNTPWMEGKSDENK